MRVMVIVKATKDSEAGVLPTKELLNAMGKYNEELVKAGIMLAGDGLKPSSKGKRVRFSGEKRTVVDGPFAEADRRVALLVQVDKQHLSPPYQVLAIGDPKTLDTALNIPGGVAATARNAGGDAQIVEENQVDITARTSVPSPRYAQPGGR